MSKLPEKNSYSGLEQPHVSVLMTAYNSAPYISEAIKSIINQTFKVFEFVIVDDGSTDDTSALINEFAQKDSRIRAIRTKNNGIGAATNRGLRECNGKYIAIMDSDDIAESCRLESQAAFLDSHLDIAGVGSQWLMIDTEGRVIGLDTHSTKPELIEILLFAFFCLHHPTIMVRRDALLAVGGYTEDRTCLAPDYDLFVRLSMAGFKLSNIPQVLFRWRLNPSGTTRSKAKTQTLSTNLIRRNAFQVLLKKDPRRAAMIATTIVETFPEGTELDKKIERLLPKHLPSPLLQHWRTLSVDHEKKTLEVSAVEWLNHESSNVSLLADELAQSNLSWLSEAVKKRAAQHSPMIPQLWDLTGGKPGEEGLLSVLVPIGFSQADLQERLSSVFNALSGNAEVLLFSDQGHKPIADLPLAPEGVRLRLLDSQESSHQCPWQAVLAEANGCYLAYIEEGFRFDPAFIGEGLSELERNESIKAVFAPARKFFLEALHEGKPILDPAPSPKWSRSTLIGHRQIYLSGFIHERSLLRDICIPLRELGNEAPKALAMDLAVRREFAVLQARNSRLIPGVTLSNRILKTMRSRLIEWYFDFGLGALPAEEYWQNLTNDQVAQIEKRLSSLWVSRELVIYRRNQQVFQKFFTKYTRDAIRSPLYRSLIRRQKWNLVQGLWNDGQPLMALQASIIVIEDYRERARNKLSKILRYKNHNPKTA